ncbi:MAG: cobalamin biosynthesis protein CobD [Desulfomonile tiedjei]|nr:cobalamin biosynthesis protein CobD [Desulfomonile tiedjei]
MALEYQILLALALDIVLGDPRWLPHPVKFIGRFAILLEQPLRRIAKNPRLAGIATAASVILVTAGLTYGIVRLAAIVHPAFGEAVSVWIIYTGLAARDMIDHSVEVWKALAAGDLDEARIKVGMICGRDTEALDSSGVIRATVESVSENMVDGVTAPLFFAVIGGPVGIMAYKAVSTLDSTFGYKNERYREFGWASAKLDDVAAFVPSRLTAILVPIAALILRQRALNSLRVFLRDRNKHPSPNAGQSEAAMAGALGLRLGGLSHYQGKPSNKPELGDPLVGPEPYHIRTANSMMLVTSGITLLAFLVLRLLLVQAWSGTV